MVQENKLVYVRLNSNEAIESKKDFLNSRLLLIELAKILKTYQILKETQGNIEKQLTIKIKSFNSNITKLNNFLPKIKIPKELTKKIKQKNISKETTEIKSKEYNEELEDELKELQKKIKQLESEI